MNVLLYVLGAILVVGGLVDVFLTVLHYDAPGLVLARSYRFVWHIARTATAALPERPRSLARSMVAPVMVAGSIGGWLGAQLLGFGLIFLPGFQSRHGFTLGQLTGSLWSALYFSAATLTSLSFSDVEPRTLGYHWLAAAETLIGLGILTLTISYLLGLYQVLRQQSVLAARIQHQSGSSNDPRSLLAPHFFNGQARETSVLVRDLHQGLTEHYQGLLRYPIVYYFHTRQPNRSIAYIFWFVGATAAALRWGLPEGHPVAADPWLPALIEGYEDMARHLEDRFLPDAPEAPPEPVPFDTFLLARATGMDPENERLKSFLAIDRCLQDLACLKEPSDAHEAYQRYQQWFHFTSCGRAFVQSATQDLGLSPQVLYEEPGRSLF
ncbi:MAG: two pore domain potassium channel family protein [Acidimicrobiaceae bacterium]|nr:two pore domain potassium channel family protein [Acidimicrobiaceae bacterium]